MKIHFRPELWLPPFCGTARAKRFSSDWSQVDCLACKRLRGGRGRPEAAAGETDCSTFRAAVNRLSGPEKAVLETLLQPPAARRRRRRGHRCRAVGGVVCCESEIGRRRAQFVRDLGRCLHER